MSRSEAQTAGERVEPAETFMDYEEGGLVRLWEGEALASVERQYDS
mgnify:CR=1 FL=1